MKAAILTIGDELTCGYRLDTNSQVISRRLALLPADVVLHLTVGDDLEAIQRALRIALDAAGVVIVTGGLGPTEDDLTRQAIAAHFGLELVEDAEALARVRERFARRGRTMPESNRSQAQAPAGSMIVQNDRGTAAGFYLPTGGKHIFVTPGIPYEMEGLLEGFILPRLQELVGDGRHVRRAALKVYGLPESEINERIRPLLARGRNPLLGLLPRRGTITVEVVASASLPAEAERLLAANLAVLRAELGRYIISEDGRDLPQVVADLLVERGLTIATAELGTGGLVAARLTETRGSEDWFRRSMIFSETDTFGRRKKSRLTYEDNTLTMASAIRQAVGADIGVGVGVIAIPEDSTPRRPYGVVHVAVNLRGRETCRRLSLNGDRARVREWAADGALALVREWVLEAG
ncbi:MAG: CinA family nicotinamide mononucleotide deamidase-related protein [Anaerolineae bacterium]|nr:CinA family nicotinamide mononucleotide deamidase-related protein [Anaerolineae bacterium]